ncbi:MAG: XF1762 family protein [Phycicoccus sp.]
MSPHDRTGDQRMKLTVTPLTLREARAFVAKHHRHHLPPRGHMFSIAVADVDAKIRGVAIIGRPIARALQDGFTAEVTRTATDGTSNANSALYGAAWRAVKAMGYRRLITYTQAGESGASLCGAGWRIVAHRPARAGWDMPGRPRVDTHSVGIVRTLWEAS